MPPRAPHLLTVCMISDDGKQNYTQNIDTLETAAGVKAVLQCHGSFATASCIQCRRNVIGTEIEEEILAGQVPLCKVCSSEDGDAANNAKVYKKQPKARKKKKQKSGRWDDDESEEDEPDLPDYPPGIMKVFLLHNPARGAANWSLPLW